MSSFKRKADTADSANSKKPKKEGSLTSFFSTTSRPSPAGTGTAEPESNGVRTNFNKEKWVASLKAEERELLQLEIDTLDISWLAHVKDVLTSPGFLNLKRFLKREIEVNKKKVLPPPEDVYSWSRHTPLHKVRVVILGQDPYHDVNQAHGLCFSVRPPTRLPPSLRNIYIALRNDYPNGEFKEPPPSRAGLLTPWAERGVLLLNTSLTVECHKAGSHSGKGWEILTQKVIDTVVKVRTRGVVFMAWGLHAAQRCAKVGTGPLASRHLVLKSVHPSPLSASKGFFTCGHFRQANDWLTERYGEDGAIDWNLGEDSSTTKRGTNDKTTSTSKTTASEASSDTDASKQNETQAKNSNDSKNSNESKNEAEAKADAKAEAKADDTKADAKVKAKAILKTVEADDDDDDDDEFEDDADAIEALEDLARSSQLEI